MMMPRNNWVAKVASGVRSLGPYAAIELLLPGGSLIALSVWAYRNRSQLASRLRRPAPVQPPAVKEAAA